MRLTVAVSTIALFAVIPPALASSSYDIQLRARVEPFCRINLPSEQPINFIGGSAQIGVVHEICNMPGGYIVRTSFSNLAGGNLNVAGENYSIDAHGDSVRQSPYPAIRDLNWQIAEANVLAAVEPVIMRVTITPH